MLLFRRHCSHCRSFCKRCRLPQRGQASGVGASRHYSGNFVADYRTPRINWIAQAGHIQLHVRRLFYWRASTFEPGMDFGASAWPQFIQDLRRLLLYAADHHYALRVTARTAGGGIASVELHANAGGLHWHLDTTTMWTDRESPPCFSSRVGYGV